MLPIASQTAGPNGLKFFVDTHGWPEGVIGQKIKFFFSKFFLSQATPGCLTSYI